MLRLQLIVLLSRMTSDVSDNELWTGIKNNNQESLARLFQRYYFLLIKSGIAYCKDVELSKDAVNDVFYNLWTHRHSLSDVSNVRAYLTTSFRNQVLALLRRKLNDTKKLGEWVDGQIDVQPSYEEILLYSQSNEEQKEKLRRALSQLTPRQKESLELKFYQGLTYEQIAETTGQAVKTVYNTVYEAIKVLRSEMLF